MRIGPEERIYIVTDPTPSSELADIFFAGNLHDLELQFRGGLTHEKRPTIFTDREEAEQEAERRLAAMKAIQAMLASPDAKAATKFQLLGPGGEVILDVDLPGLSDAVRD